MNFIKLPKKSDSRGFTLIEILVVIGIIAVLAAIVLIAINPARQFAQARNTERTSNVNAILNAVGQYIADNQGALPTSVDSLGDDVRTEISSSNANLCDDLVSDYLPAFPIDPQEGDGASIEEADCGSFSSAYYVTKKANGRITIDAIENQELSPVEDIEITR